MKMLVDLIGLPEDASDQDVLLYAESAYMDMPGSRPLDGRSMRVLLRGRDDPAGMRSVETVWNEEIARFLQDARKAVDDLYPGQAVGILRTRCVEELARSATVAADKFHPASWRLVCFGRPEGLSRRPVLHTVLHNDERAIILSDPGRFALVEFQEK